MKNRDVMRRAYGNKQHWCCTDMHFGAVGNLQAQQDEIDDSCKQKKHYFP
jgi:hypothetical protein